MIDFGDRAKIPKFTSGMEYDRNIMRYKLFKKQSQARIYNLNHDKHAYLITLYKTIINKLRLALSIILEVVCIDRMDK